MSKIPFWKMSGSGNDFIIIDNRDGSLDRLKTPSFIRAVCLRKLSVGADGLIFIEASDSCDFSWCFFNADGSEAEMCGNGGRCAARFAYLNDMAGSALSFETIAGVIRAEISGSHVKIQLSRPGELQTNTALDVDGTSLTIHTLNTGVPHVVCFVDDIEAVPVKDLGATIRFHRRFQPAGTNVNFVSPGVAGVFSIRTYERGVEDETLACGTGCVAAALTAIALGKAQSPVRMHTRSGEVLGVHTNEKAPPFSSVYLEGGATVVYDGELWEESYSSV